MDLQLSGKVALITGASREIGHAIVETLAPTLLQIQRGLHETAVVLQAHLALESHAVTPREWGDIAEAAMVALARGQS